MERYPSLFIAVNGRQPLFQVIEARLEIFCLQVKGCTGDHEMKTMASQGSKPALEAPRLIG